MSNLFEDMTIQKACDTIWNYIDSKTDKGVPYDDGVVKGITVHYDDSELTELDISMWYLLKRYLSAQRKIDKLQKENEYLKSLGDCTSHYEKEIQVLEKALELIIDDLIKSGTSGIYCERVGIEYCAINECNRCIKGYLLNRAEAKEELESEVE